MCVRVKQGNPGQTFESRVFVSHTRTEAGARGLESFSLVLFVYQRLACVSVRVSDSWFSWFLLLFCCLSPCVSPLLPCSLARWLLCLSHTESRCLVVVVLSICVSSLSICVSIGERYT